MEMLPLRFVFLVIQQAGGSSTVPAIATVQSDVDTMYNGVTNTEVSIFVENTTPPELLVQTSSAQVTEGTPLTYQVALSTTPGEEVAVEVQAAWLDGIPRGLTISPSRVLFLAGQPKKWQTVTIDVPYTPAYDGKGVVSLTHTSFSDDPFFSSTTDVGIQPMVEDFQVDDVDSVGVCLTKCSIVSKFNHIFTRDGLNSGDPFVSPYEIVDGQVPYQCHCANLVPTITKADSQEPIATQHCCADSTCYSPLLQLLLPFLLKSEPLGNVEVTLSARMAGGSVRVVPSMPFQASESTPLDASGGSLQFSASTWSTDATVMLQVTASLSFSDAFPQTPI